MVQNLPLGDVSEQTQSVYDKGSESVSSCLTDIDAFQENMSKRNPY